MATAFTDTPKWFDTEYYLSQKVAQKQATDPKGNWDRAAVLKDFETAGFDNPYDHYKLYGDIEGLSANPLFNNAEYLAAKAALNGSTWTVEMVAKDIADHGLTLMEHYIQFGGKYENLSPSSDFDQNKYFDAKLQAHIAAEPDKGWTLDMVKADFAAAGISALEHYMRYAEVEGLDKYDYSVNGDPIPHPGNTKIVLTKDADTVTPDATVAELKTSDRDDVISGVVGTSTTSTLTAGDVIDGGAGMDTLKLDMQGSFTYKSGSIKNVEHIVLDNASGKTFDAKGVEKALSYTVNGGEKGATIKNVDSVDTGYSLSQTKGTFLAQINDSALASKTDIVDVALNGVGASSASADRVTLNVTGAGSGVVEGLNLAANGADSFVKLGQDYKTVSVHGAGNFDVAAAAGMETFNASAATGKIVANLSGSLGTLKTINGGSTDDTLTVGALLGSAVVDGGDGKDTLNFAALAAGSTIKNAISDVETFEVIAASGANASGSMTFDLSKVTGLETFKIGGVTDDAGSGDFFLTKAGDYEALNLQIGNELASVKSFTYEGKGALNVSLAGDTSGEATSGDTSLATLTAGTITDLTVTNDADTGALTIGALSATALTDLVINTGSEDGVTFTGSTAKLNNLTTVTINGDAAVNFTHGTSASKINEVNAENLTGSLTLDLRGASLAGTEGVVVTMGSGGTGTDGLAGTAKADTFNLGAGAEKIKLAAGAVSAADLIIGFGNGADTLDTVYTLSTSTGLVVAASGKATFTDGKAFGTKTVQASLKDTTELAKQVSGAADSGTGLVLFTDGTNVGIYDLAAASSGSSVVVTLRLMGILDNTDIASLDYSMFV